MASCGPARLWGRGGCSQEGFMPPCEEGHPCLAAGSHALLTRGLPRCHPNTAGLAVHCLQAALGWVAWLGQSRSQT